MTQQVPPAWLERMLMYCLPTRDQETISGDLLEEYRQYQVPRFGSMRANFWYFRQSISFLSVRRIVGPPITAALICMSVFTAAAGIWLLSMERILKHAGYGERTAVDVFIAIQGLATLLVLVRNDRSLLRGFVLIGAVGLGLMGASAIRQILQMQHFEGFVLVIGFALVLQTLLTLAVVLRAFRRKTF